jgi:hypothetical protein
MGTFKTLSGRGELKDAGRPIGEAEYKIHLSQSGAIRSGRGELYSDPDVISDAFDARNLTITRQDTGKDIGIIVESYNGGAQASIILSGSPD